MKGEGSDPHLRAVKTDPLGGVASIERGIKRIVKGAPKGSFSEVQGGIGSIVRGTVKISPGDIQQKKKLKEDINENLRAITWGALALTGGLGLHALFMRRNSFGYRYGIGRDINESARTGINSILDATPIVGRERARTREAAAASGASIQRRLQFAATQSPKALLTDLSKGRTQLTGTRIETSNISGNGALSKSLGEADTVAKESGLNFYNWNQRSRENFWTTEVQYSYDSRNKAAVNVFAEPAAKDYLAKQFKLTAEEQSSDMRIRDAIREKMQVEKDTMLDQAEALGFSVSRKGNERIIKDEDIKPFVEQFTRKQLGSGNYPAKFVTQYESKIAKILQDTNISDTARSLYNDTVDGYNNYFNEVAKRIKSIPGAAPITSDQRTEGYDAVLRDADQLRAVVLSNKLKFSNPIEGPAHIELINLTYYHTKAVGTAKSPYGVSDRLAQAAASEISKRPVNSAAEAFNLLNNEYGFKNARPIRATRDPFKKQVAAKPKTKARRAVKLKTEQELIETYLKSGYSQEAAENAAKKAILEREKRAALPPKPAPKRAPAKPETEVDKQARKSRTDLIQRLVEEGYSRETAARMVDENRVPIDMFDEASPRVDAYLETRARLDKRCGKSGIPDTKKCSKPTAAQSEAARNRERGRKTPGVTCNPPNKQCGNLCIPATATCHINSGSALKTGAGLALTAGAGILAFRNRRLIQTTARSGIIKANRNVRGFSAKVGRTKLGTKVRRKSAAAVRYSKQWRARYERMNPQQRRRLVGATIARGSREARLAAGSLGGLAAIKGLSSKQVSDGIERLPEEWRPKARNLVGKAKAGAAQVQLESQGFKIKDIDEDNNFSIWRNQKGDIRMISSVDDTLINFNAKRVRQGNFFEGTGRPTYDVAFLTDQSFDQKQVDPETGRKVLTRISQLFDQARQEMPRGEVILTNTPYKNDGKGDTRAAIYRRARFNYLPDRDDVQWAVMRDREMVRLSKDEADDLFDEILTENNPFDNDDFDPDVDGEYFEMDKADAFNIILRTDGFKRGINSPRVQTYLHTRARLDKKCGKTGIPDNRKCTKPIVQTAALVTAAAVGAGALIKLRRRALEKQYMTPRTAQGIIERSVSERQPLKRSKPEKPVEEGSHKLNLPANRKASEWHDNLLNLSGMHEGHRQRRYEVNNAMRPIETDEIVSNIRKIADSPEGALSARIIEREKLRFDPKVLDNIVKTPTLDADIKQQLEAIITATKDSPPFEGLYIDPTKVKEAPVNSVYINFRRKTDASWTPDKTSISESINKFLDIRSNLKPGSMPSPDNKVEMSKFVNTFSTYSLASDDNRDFILGLHEMGHAIDIGKGGKRYPLTVTDATTGKQHSAWSKEFVTQAQKVTSTYGLSDIDDSRNEFFTENFVLYTLAPKRLKKEAPLIYDWVDQYLKAIDSNS